MRQHYVDNLRWMVILLLIPYHAAQAWNTWGEPNYIIIEGNRAISSLIVLFSPFIMPLMFLLAGMSTKFALSKRTPSQFISERAARLLVPLLFGTLVFMPVMTYLADRYNHGYSGSFISHYAVFFTKFTDLTGADGGFSFGQFWFLLYLFIISIVSLGIILLMRKISSKSIPDVPLWAVILLGLPLPFIHDLLSIGGKSLVEYTYLFLLGYYVFSLDTVVEKIRKISIISAVIGVLSAVINVYLFLWSGLSGTIWNSITYYVAEWAMLLALIGLGKNYLNFTGKVSGYLAGISFAFFSLHFIFVVLTQSILSGVLAGNTVLQYTIPVILSYILTFGACAVVTRVPVFCFLLGVKKRPKD